MVDIQIETIQMIMFLIMAIILHLKGDRCHQSWRFDWIGFPLINADTEATWIDLHIASSSASEPVLPRASESFHDFEPSRWRGSSIPLPVEEGGPRRPPRRLQLWHSCTTDQLNRSNLARSRCWHGAVQAFQGKFPCFQTWWKFISRDKFHVAQLWKGFEHSAIYQIWPPLKKISVIKVRFENFNLFG